MDEHSQYSPLELMQTIGQLYVDISRSHIMIRQLQQVVRDKDSIISQLESHDNSDESGQADPTLI